MSCSEPTLTFCVRRLPPVLEPLGSNSLAVVRLSQPSGHFGAVPWRVHRRTCAAGDRPVFHLFTGIKTSFSGTVAGRDVWGMPLQTGDITMDWVEDILKIRVGRHGVEFVQLAVRLEKNLGLSPPESDRAMLTLGTFASRRRTTEHGPIRNVLIGLDKVKQNEALHNSDDPRGETNYWEASSVLKLVNGEPGDDWSIFPVHQVLKTCTSSPTDGRTAHSRRRRRPCRVGRRTVSRSWSANDVSASDVESSRQGAAEVKTSTEQKWGSSSRSSIQTVTPSKRRTCGRKPVSRRSGAMTSRTVQVGAGAGQRCLVRR